MSERHSGRPVLLFGLLVLTTVAQPPTSEAQERVFRTFGPDDGLAVPPVWALAQDSLGFIWVGSESGLFRFDGSEIVRWDPERIPGLTMDVAVSPTGRVVALTAEGRIYDLRTDGARELDIPWEARDAPRRSGRVMAFDASGGLWIHVGDSIWGIEAGPPELFVPDDFDGEIPRGLVRAMDGVLVLTEGGVWRATSDGARRLYRTDESSGEVVAWAIEPQRGRVLALLNVASTQVPRIVEIRSGAAATVETTGPLPRSRAITLRERGGTLWVALDRFLAAVRPGEQPELLGPEEGYESGGPLLVDREGSLWVGSFVGLHQYAEPDTRLWAERQGIPSRHTRFIERSGSVVWAMTWNGPAFLERTERGWTTTPIAWDSRSHICASADGAVWSASPDGLLEIRGRTVIPRGPLTDPVHGCAPGLRGGAWLGTGQELVYVHPDRQDVVPIELPFAGEARDPRPALLHDRQDRLWVGAGAAVCHASVAALLNGQATWTCDDVATPSGVSSMVELEDGRLWAAAGPAGLLENTGDGWSVRTVTGVPTQTLHALETSPRGGTWIIGDGVIRRVRIAGDGRMEVLERLTPWHGLPAEAAGDIYEEESGDLWLATNRGIGHVPAHVRFAEPPLPPVLLVEARIDDRPVPVDGPLVLPHDENRIELRFAALAFRHRAGLRHEVRLSPNEPWIAASDEPHFRWVDLPPGTYSAEYRASRDGTSWSVTTAGYSFRIAPPWYDTWWFMLLTMTAAVGLAVLIYRARVGYLLGLEQQRTRIAMDLHDQVGSGLASVGILSGLMASDQLGTTERRDTATEIAEVAEELGHSLSDIVWALDPETSSLEELGARLVEHGERLFPDDEVRFEADVSAGEPGVVPSMTVRRAVLLIGLEALHNAARHADATRVSLSVRPRGGGWWEMTVHDDGSGVSEAAPHGGGPSRSRASSRNGGSGRGLVGMQQRANDIGAHVDIASGPGGGTTVSLRFHPAADSTGGFAKRIAGPFRSAGRMIMRRRPRP